jgi:hypothetical protein
MSKEIEMVNYSRLNKKARAMNKALHTPAERLRAIKVLKDAIQPEHPGKVLVLNLAMIAEKGIENCIRSSHSEGVVFSK